MDRVPTVLPFDPDSAPPEYVFPKHMVAVFEQVMARSGQPRGTIELASAIVRDGKTHALSVKNLHQDNAGNFIPDRALAAGQNTLGLFYTSGGVGFRNLISLNSFKLFKVKISS